MRVNRPLHLFAAVALCVTAACDKDPSNPAQSFRVAACPASAGVNDALTLTFTGGQPLAGTITGQNVVVSNAVTGVELPGSLSSNSSGGVVFTPAQPLPFGTRIRVRVQNIRAQGSNTAVELFVCEFTTSPPPIAELVWDRLSDAGGRPLFGGALIAKDSGFVISQTSILYKKLGGDFGVAYSSPYALSGFDVNFVSPSHGFISIFEPRLRQSTVMETLNGALTTDTIFTTAGLSAFRLFFRAAPGLVGAGTNPVFGVVGAGTTNSAVFYKWRPQTRSASQVLTVSQVSGVTDVDFATDTTRGVAVGGGLKSGSVQPRGKVWVSSNGGSTWTEVTNAAANNTAVSYNGVAIRNSGTEIFVAGSGGYFLKLTAAAPGGPYTVTRIPLNQLQPTSGPALLAISDSTNPDALIFSDVQFAPDNDQKGWLIGGELLSNPGSEPRYQGFIYRTTDGGATWVRQGVRAAAKFGADMPRLRRLSILNQNNVWIVGDGGAVLTYHP